MLHPDPQLAAFPVPLSLLLVVIRILSSSSSSVIETEKSVEMAHEMIAGALRRSIENVGALTHILAVRCKETQESNTCEKPASQSGILIAVVITTG